jgi:hypothetical protein
MLQKWLQTALMEQEKDVKNTAFFSDKEPLL